MKRVYFVYDKEYLKMPNKKAISLTPLQEEEFKSLFISFYNLLAEGKLKIFNVELRIDKDDDFQD